MLASLKLRLRRALLEFLGRSLRRPAPAHLPPRPRVLLIRPDHLGDVLLAGAGVARLWEALPDAHLSLLVGPWSLEVARRGARVDALRAWDFPGFSRRPARNPLAPYWSLLRLARRLRREHFDMALVLRPDHWWGALLALIVGVPLRLGYATPLTAPLLSHTLPLPPDAHAVELGLRLAQAAARLATGEARTAILRPAGTARLGARGEPPLPEGEGTSLSSPRPALPLRVDPEDEAAAQALLAHHGLPERNFLVLHPGSGSPLKAWPPERWAEAADALAKRFGCAVVVTGGPDERLLVDAVAARMATPVVALAGQTPLGTLAALLRRAGLVLGTDSGPLHLAAALGTPTLRLYGPTDPRRFGPWGAPEHHRLAHGELPCSPCGNLFDPPCGARALPPCMLAISVEQVLAEASLLAGPD